MNHNFSRLEQDSHLNIRAKKHNSLIDKDRFDKNTRGDYDDENERDRGSDRGLDRGSDRGLDRGSDRGLDRGLDRSLDRSLDGGLDRGLDRSNNIFSGEITGKDMRMGDGEYGMPMRSQFFGKKLTKKEDTVNTFRSDFDLYDEDETITNKYKINSYDPVGSIKTPGMSGLGYSGFNEVHTGTDKVIPELYGSDPGSFISVNANNFSAQMNLLLQTQYGSHDKFCISAYSLFCIFSGIYTVSQGRTETDIYDYFGMISKENIHDGLIYINNLMEKISDQVNIKNIIFVSDEHIINNQIVKYLSKIVTIQPIAPTHSDTEYKIINGYLKRISNGVIAPISKKIIDNANVLCLSAGYIRPKWKISFTKVIESQFKKLDNTHKLVKMLNIMDTQFDYCEDNFMQMIEFKCIGEKLSMGIILPKELNEPTIKASELISCIKELRPTMFDEVSIPTFVQQMKIRLSNIIYQSGLKTIFTGLYIPELIKNSESRISDIVQNITVVVTNVNTTNDNKKKTDKRYRSGISNIKFVADHPFLYYFRLIPTNTIILMGYYT